MGRSQSTCGKKSRDGLSTNQKTGFGGVVKQDGALETGCCNQACSMSRGCPNKVEKQEVITEHDFLYLQFYNIRENLQIKQ